jgi:4-amino-4-deoxy-L-arabinose transferase-like glycosyltransferase
MAPMSVPTASEGAEAPAQTDPRDDGVSEPAAIRLDRISDLVLCGLVLFVLWILPLRSSFWTDETVTGFVVQNGFRNMLHRAFEFQPMFPTYYLIAWVARTIGGMREWVLRLPSIIAMAAATVIVARIGRRLFDREAGILAAVVFAISPQGVRIAGDARPYALGILALVVATFWLIRWLDTGDLRTAIGYVVAAALVVYIHYLLAAALLAHVAYALRRRSAVGIAALVGAAVGFVVVLVPLVPWFVDTYDRRSVLSLDIGNVGDVVRILTPPSIVAGMLVGALFAGRRLRLDTARLATNRDDVVLLALWAMFPPIVLLAAAHVAGVGIFEPRYVSSALPAVALFAGGAIRMVDPWRARRAVILGVVGASLLIIGLGGHPDDAGVVQDWRGVASAVQSSVTDPTTPVAMQVALIEGQQVGLLQETDWARYLTAPASVYSFGGRLVPVPYGLSRNEKGYLETIVEGVLIPAGRFLFVSRPYDLSVEHWLEGRLARDGFTPTVIVSGVVSVVEFSNTGSAR